MQQRICDRCGALITERTRCRVYKTALDGKNQVSKTGKDLCPGCLEQLEDFLSGRAVPAVIPWTDGKAAD